MIVTYKIAILTTPAPCHTFTFFLQTRNYIPCPDGQTATNLTIETMEKMYCDNSFDACFGLKNKEIHSLHIEWTILEQNQNQKKTKQKLVLQENGKTSKKHEDVHSLYWEMYFEELIAVSVVLKSELNERIIANTITN